MFFTREEHAAALAAVREDKNILAQISHAIPWGSISGLVEMLNDPAHYLWGWEGMSITPYSGAIYRVACIYGTQILRYAWGFEFTSSGKHRVSVTLSPDGEVVELNTGTDKSQQSFGGDYTPAERVEVVAERLRAAGLRVARNATATAHAEIRSLQQLERLLGTGPERPGTRVRKALKRGFHRDLVMVVAARLWPLSYAGR